MFELFLSETCELVDTEFVCGRFGVVVVREDLLEVFVEDQASGDGVRDVCRVAVFSEPVLIRYGGCGGRKTAAVAFIAAVAIVAAVSADDLSAYLSAQEEQDQQKG